MEYSGARGKLIHEKNQKQKISWHCPFKGTFSRDGFGCWWHVRLLVSFRPNADGAIFFNYLDAPLILWSKKCISPAVTASLHWRNNVSCVYLVHVPLLRISQQGLGHFFRYRPLLTIGWRTVQIVRQRRRKMINTGTAPTTLSAIQAASQSTFISALHLLSAGNDKQK